MCGIVGFINGNKNSQDFKIERALFEQMLYADALRGWDSTGIFWKDGKGDCQVFKKAMAAADFLDLNAINKILTNIDKYDFMIGHNRWATQGGVNNSNAHPFQHGPITMVHNGTLRSWKHLKDAGKFKVDSEFICWLIAEYGIEEVTPMLDGAFALVWHDARNNTVNLLRNDERPLSFAYVTANDGNAAKSDVIISSEYGLINWLAPRNKYKIDKIYTTSPGKLIVFDRNDLKNYETKEMKLKPAVVQGNWTNNKAANDKKLSDSNPVLKEVGLKFEDEMEICFSDWEFYQKSGAFGYLVDYIVLRDKVFEVRLNGLSFKDGSQLVNKWMSVKIKSAWKPAGDGEYPIITVGDHRTLSAKEKTENRDDEKNSNTKSANTGIKYTAYDKREITREQWLERTKCGCAWCSTVPEEKDAPDLVWEDYNTFTCLECAAELNNENIYYHAKG